MTITEHKTLVAAIPEDLNDGDEIEVSDDGIKWKKRIFSSYAGYDGLLWVYLDEGEQQGWGSTDVIEDDVRYWKYNRRPATAHQQHMSDLDKGIKSAEAGINRHLEQRRQNRKGLT